MSECYIEVDGNPPELLYQDASDGTVYHNKGRFKSAWAKMSENLSRTVREILIQRPELIPVFAGFIEANQEEFADFLPSEKRA